MSEFCGSNKKKLNRLNKQANIFNRIATLDISNNRKTEFKIVYGFKNEPV